MSVSKDIIIDLMNTSTIEDIEIIGEEWPLRWVCPIFNDQYDFESNPLELYKDYEHSGTDESKMISIQSEIIIEQKDEDLFIIEEGTLWSESHVWCKEINTSTPGCLPLYNKKEIKGAIEKLFSVKVKAVNIINTKGKVKRFKGVLGKRKDTKKAVITLVEGNTIDISAGV